MSSFLSFRHVALLAVVFAGLPLPAPGRDGAPKADPRLRFICVSSLEEDQQVVLASRNAAKEWQELGAVELRNSNITDWMPAKLGELHLALKDGKNLKSICSFTCPDTIRSALVVLTADAEKGEYEARVLDSETAGFVKGSLLILNMSEIPGLVQLGPDEHKIEAGQQLVAKPTLEETGMYRLMASRFDENGKPVLCHDRYVSGKADTRGIVFLLPHESRGFRVFSMPLFGPLD